MYMCVHVCYYVCVRIHMHAGAKEKRCQFLLGAGGTGCCDPFDVVSGN